MRRWLSNTSHHAHGLRCSITLLALLLAVAAEYWTSAGVSLTLPDITGTLGASSDETSWALTAYTTAFAVGIALSHRLSAVFGNRVYLTFCATLFAISSIGCGLSSGLPSFLVFRILEGFGGGAFLVRSFVFFTQNISISERAHVVTNFGMEFFLIGRFLANLAAGWMVDHASWRYLFAVSSALAALAALLFALFCADYWRELDKDGKPVDLLGVALIVVAASTLQVALSRGEIEDWFSSNLICWFLVIGLIGNLSFVLWQLSVRNASPLLDLRYLKTKTVYAGSLLAFALGMLLTGSLYVIPQYLRVVEAHSASQTGLLLSVGSAATILLSWLLLRFQGLVRRSGARAVIAAALVVEMVSQLIFAHVLTPDTPDYALWLPIFLNGAFLALSIPTLGTVTFQGVDESETSSARAIFYGVRQFGASLGVTLAVVLIDRRSWLHSGRLFEGYFNRNLSALAQNTSITDASAKALDLVVRKQSMVLSFADIFYVMAGIAFFALFLIPLLPGAAPAPIQPAKAVLENSLPQEMAQ